MKKRVVSGVGLAVTAGLVMMTISRFQLANTVKMVSHNSAGVCLTIAVLLMALGLVVAKLNDTEAMPDWIFPLSFFAPVMALSFTLAAYKFVPQSELRTMYSVIALALVAPVAAWFSRWIFFAAAVVYIVIVLNILTTIQ